MNDLKRPFAYCYLLFFYFLKLGLLRNLNQYLILSYFFAEAPMEDIKANNPDGKSAFDISNGEVVFSIPINSLMQEHFNLNNSSRYNHEIMCRKV